MPTPARIRWSLPGLLLVAAGGAAVWTAWPSPQATPPLQVLPKTAPVRLSGASAAPPSATGLMPSRASTPGEVRAVVSTARAAGPEHAAELRRMALTAEDPLVVGNALQALGRLGLVASDPQLTALIDDPRPRVRHETILALGREPRVIPVLERVLARGDAKTRAIAVHVLEGIDDPRARALLASRGANDSGTRRPR